MAGRRQVNGGGLGHLSELRALQKLDLTWSNVTDESLAELKAMTSLRELGTRCDGRVGWTSLPPTSNPAHFAEKAHLDIWCCNGPRCWARANYCVSGRSITLAEPDTTGARAKAYGHARNLPRSRRCA